MKFNIEKHVEAIIQTRNGREQANHLWFYGFHNIVNGNSLERQKVEAYLKQKLEEHPKFNAFISSAQILGLLEAYLQGYDSESPLPMHRISIKKRSSSEKFDQIKKLIDAGKMPSFFHVHLPINDSYHLEFPIVDESGLCKFIYTTCEDCEVLETHGFPEITLRRSIDFSGNREAMESIREGTFFYDNRISVNHQSREVMIEAYKAFRDFVETTKVK